MKKTESDDNKFDEPRNQVSFSPPTNIAKMFQCNVFYINTAVKEPLFHYQLEKNGLASGQA